MPTAEHKFDQTERDARSIEYAGRVLDPDTLIVITGSRDYLSSIQGQQALLTAANLFARMTYSLEFSLPNIENIFPEIAPGETLDVAIPQFAHSVNPRLNIESRRHNKNYTICVGIGSADINVLGSDWVGVYGNNLSDLPPPTSEVGFGVCAAVCAAAAHIFDTNFGQVPGQTHINLYDRRVSPEPPSEFRTEETPASLGNIWLVGCGSIGSSALFFLALGPTGASLNLIDGDVVENYNLDRAGCFLAMHLGEAKVKACALFLENCSQLKIRTDAKFLHESTLWSNRRADNVDIIVPAANEYGVRERIENSFPPVQVYATTGSYWQTSVWCHVPAKTGCSCCVFGSDASLPAMKCAAGSISNEPPVDNGQGGNDASLPFLSFLAGLLTACELYRIASGHCPPARYDVWTSGNPQFHVLDVARRPGCLCQTRSVDTHGEVISKSKYAYLSTNDRS